MGSKLSQTKSGLSSARSSPDFSLIIDSSHHSMSLFKSLDPKCSALTTSLHFLLELGIEPHSPDSQSSILATKPHSLSEQGTETRSSDVQSSALTTRPHSPPRAGNRTQESCTSHWATLLGNARTLVRLIETKGRLLRDPVQYRASLMHLHCPVATGIQGFPRPCACPAQHRAGFIRGTLSMAEWRSSAEKWI